MKRTILIVSILHFVIVLSAQTHKIGVELKYNTLVNPKIEFDQSEYAHIWQPSVSRGYELGFIRYTKPKNSRIEKGHGLKVGYLTYAMDYTVDPSLVDDRILDFESTGELFPISNNVYFGYKYHFSYDLLMSEKGRLAIGVQPALLYSISIVNASSSLSYSGVPVYTESPTSGFDDQKIIGDITAEISYRVGNIDLSIFGIWSTSKTLHKTTELFGKDSSVIAKSSLKHQGLGVSLRFGMFKRRN